MKKETKESWRDSGISYALQTKYAAEQCAKYLHLMHTQQEAGNLPQVIDKWQKLHREALTALNAHISRGVRWQFCTQAEAVYLFGIDKLNKSSLIS